MYAPVAVSTQLLRSEAIILVFPHATYMQFKVLFTQFSTIIVCPLSEALAKISVASCCAIRVELHLGIARLLGMVISLIPVHVSIETTLLIAFL